MRFLDWLPDLFLPREPPPIPPSREQRYAAAIFEDMQRDQRELAAARRVIGGWGGNALAAGLSRALDVPVRFDPDPRDVEAVRDALYPRPGTVSR